MCDRAAIRPNTGLGVGPDICTKTTTSKRTASVKPRAQLKTRSIILLPPGRLCGRPQGKNATTARGINTGMVNLKIVFISEFDSGFACHGAVETQGAGAEFVDGASIGAAGWSRSCKVWRT